MAVSLSHLLRRPWRALQKLQRTWHASLSMRKECLGGSWSSPSLAPECEVLSNRDLRGNRLLYLWVVSRSWPMLSVSQLEADLEFVASQSQAGLCSLGSRPASSLPAEPQSKLGHLRRLHGHLVRMPSFFPKIAQILLSLVSLAQPLLVSSSRRQAKSC